MSYINTFRGTAGAGSGEAGQAQDQFGRRIAIRLEQGSQELPHDISERLRAARVRAISQRKREAGVAMALPQLAAAGIGQQFGQGPGLWSRLASGLPVLVLAAGLVCIQALEADRRANEVAEVDAALLADDLPPEAYADAGFVQFLKSDR